MNINHSQKEKEDEYIHPQKEVSKEKSGGVDKKYYKNTSEKRDLAEDANSRRCHMA